jgi:hypothetical protein
VEKESLVPISLNLGCAKSRCKAWVSIAYDGASQALMAEHRVEICASNGKCGSIIRDWCKENFLAKAINKNTNAGMSLRGFGEPYDQVHADLLPAVLRYGKRLERSCWYPITGLVPLTLVVRPDVVPDILLHTGPKEGAHSELFGLVHAKVSGDAAIMGGVKDLCV